MCSREDEINPVTILGQAEQRDRGNRKTEHCSFAGNQNSAWSLGLMGLVPLVVYCSSWRRWRDYAVLLNHSASNKVKL